MSSINGPEDLKRGELEQLVFAILDGLGWSASRETVDKSTVGETEIALTGLDTSSSTTPRQRSEPPADANPLKFQRRQIYEDGIYLFVDQTTRFPTWVFRRRAGGIWYYTHFAGDSANRGQRAANLSGILPCIGPLTF